jgi:hypothetical protein
VREGGSEETIEPGEAMVVVMKRDELLTCTLLEEGLHPFVVIRFPPPVDAIDWYSLLHRGVVRTIAIGSHLDHGFVGCVDGGLEEVRRVWSFSQLFHLLTKFFRRVCWEILHMDIGLHLWETETESQ